MQSMFYAMLTLARGYTVALDQDYPGKRGSKGAGERDGSSPLRELGLTLFTH